MTVSLEGAKAFRIMIVGFCLASITKVALSSMARTPVQCNGCMQQGQLKGGTAATEKLGPAAQGGTVVEGPVGGFTTDCLKKVHRRRVLSGDGGWQTICSTRVSHKVKQKT